MLRNGCVVGLVLPRAGSSQRGVGWVQAKLSLWGTSRRLPLCAYMMALLNGSGDGSHAAAVLTSGDGALAASYEPGGDGSPGAGSQEVWRTWQFWLAICTLTRGAAPFMGHLELFPRETE